MNNFSLTVALLVAFTTYVAAQLPASPGNLTTITLPNGHEIRYSLPGKHGVCETTEGVNSFSGYLSSGKDTNVFFWFFEARDSPEDKPITLWLEGGPGGDSLYGLFDLVGPCRVQDDLSTKLNPHSFTEESNVLFLSQPLGVGFSFEGEIVDSRKEKIEGVFNEDKLVAEPSDDPTGRFASASPYRTKTSDQAAKIAWPLIQDFYAALPKIAPRIKSDDFHLWTLSFGGHFGLSFLDHFWTENEKIKAGKEEGTELHFKSLGVFNGIIDIAVQMPLYVDYAMKNGYEKLVNETIADFMRMAMDIPGEYIDWCQSSEPNLLETQITCSQAVAICRNMVEGPPENLSGRNPYDVREPITGGPEISPFMEYLNQPEIQNAIGVDLNYSSYRSLPVFQGFQVSGDWAYPMTDKLTSLLDGGVEVALIYGDADYLANWMGGEAVSLAAEHKEADQFRKTDYVATTVGKEKVGETREFGGLSFTRLDEAGHDVPYYKPKASLEIFKRILRGERVSDGLKK